jgi:outer membrane receptor for ferrienterochelin and colicins
MRYNHNSEFEDHTTWQLSAMTNINWLTLRGNFATGFKTPTLKERYMDFRVPIGFPISVKGNPNLVPEESKYLSVSAEVNLKKLNFSVNVFRNSIDKMIAEVLQPFNPAELGLNYIYQNINKVKVIGVDVLFQWQPVHALRVNGGYSYYSALDRELDRQLIGSRNHSARLNIDYYFEHKYKPMASLQGSYFGDTYRTIIDEISGHEINAWLEDFTLWKLIVSAKPIAGVTISTGIDNIMDYTDKKTFATFSPGRTYFVGLSVSL